MCPSVIVLLCEGLTKQPSEGLTEQPSEGLTEQPSEGKIEQPSASCGPLTTTDAINSKESQKLKLPDIKNLIYPHWRTSLVTAYVVVDRSWQHSAVFTSVIVCVYI